MSVEQDLYEIRKQIVFSKEKLAQKRAELSLLMKENKEKYGVNNSKEADEKIRSLEKQIARDERRLQKVMDRIEEEIRKYK